MYTDRYKIAIEGHLDTHLETINSTKDFISIGSSLEAFNLYKFSDTMNIIPAPIQSGAGSTLSRFIGRIPSPVVGTASSHIKDPKIGGELTNLKAIHEYRDSVAKAMLISILDGDSKRTTTIGVGSTASKVSVFFNCLKKVGIGTTDSNLTFRDYSSKPWNNWNDSVGV